MALALLRLRFDVAFQLREYSHILPAEFPCDQWFRYFEQAGHLDREVSSCRAMRLLCSWLTVFSYVIPFVLHGRTDRIEQEVPGDSEGV